MSHLRAVYLDCAATAPIDARVHREVMRLMAEDFGNANSRTHDYGNRARQSVEKARGQISDLAGASRAEVIFTSGATEANNLVILGLAPWGEKNGRRHIVSSLIEHNAVLEPLGQLQRRGFDVTYVPPLPGGWVDPAAVLSAVRNDTLLVSIMHANNETGVIQPISEIAAGLVSHEVFFHVDAAQTFGRLIEPLQNTRIDFISVSGHKLHGPMGVGALVARRRNRERAPLEPIAFGGGQEWGLRPGTLPVALIAGFGLACELAGKEAELRRRLCQNFRQNLLDGLRPLDPEINGDQERVLPHIINLSFGEIDAESAMEALEPLVAISNGSACTSASESCSHVLAAMRLDPARAENALRWSWCHMTEEPHWPAVVDAIQKVR